MDDFCTCNTDDAAVLRDHRTVFGGKRKWQHLARRLLNKTSSNILDAFPSINQCWVHQGEQDLFLALKKLLSSGQTNIDANKCNKMRWVLLQIQVV